MKKIDNLYDKVNNEVTKSFELKHEKLTNEENNMKEKLQNEVTKVKEKLELFLSESNRIIQMFEKINKGIRIFENEEKNMIKTLSYVSKINKSQKEMNSIFVECMRNINITFQEDQNNIKYEEYYFNGIPVPKDIEIKDLASNSFKIFWKIDDINILNLDKNQIKYRLETRKEKSNVKFEQI